MSSVSAATRLSAVMKSTREPSSELPSKLAGTSPLPPVGPVETSVVWPPERS
jgi:hypothetical protein